MAKKCPLWSLKLDDLHFGTSSSAITGAGGKQTHSKALIQTANMFILPAALLMFPEMDHIVQPERISSAFHSVEKSNRVPQSAIKAWTEFFTARPLKVWLH